MRTIVIGLLGSTLDAGRPASAGSAGARRSTSVRHEDLARPSPRAADPAAAPTRWPTEVAGDIASRLAGDEVRLHAARARRTRGTSRRSTARSTTSRAPTRSTRRGGLPRPHHHRHARRADLPVPAHRVAHFPARLLQTSPPRRRARAKPGTYTLIDLDLSRYDRLASRFAARAARGALVPQVRHRHAQRRLQPADRADRAGGDRLARAPAPHRADRRRQVAARPPHLRAQEGAAAGGGRLRRGQLRHAARRRGDVRALRPRARAPSPAPCRTAPGCCARPTAACSSSTRSASSGSDEQAMLLRAARGARRFLPVGSRPRGAQRLPAHRRHQPRPRRARCATGRFREDLLARINLWTFRLPGLARAARGHRAQPRLRARALGRGATAGG